MGQFGCRRPNCPTFLPHIRRAVAAGMDRLVRKKLIPEALDAATGIVKGLVQGLHKSINDNPRQRGRTDCKAHTLPKGNGDTMKKMALALLVALAMGVTTFGVIENAYAQEQPAADSASGTKTKKKRRRRKKKAASAPSGAVMSTNQF